MGILKLVRVVFFYLNMEPISEMLPSAAVPQQVAAAVKRCLLLVALPSGPPSNARTTATTATHVQNLAGIAKIAKMSINVDLLCAAEKCCNTKSAYPAMPFFQFPPEASLAFKWALRCNPDLVASTSGDLVDYRICAEHFEDSAFEDPKTRCRLKPDALPFPKPVHDRRKVAVLGQTDLEVQQTILKHYKSKTTHKTVDSSAGSSAKRQCRFCAEFVFAKELINVFESRHLNYFNSKLKDYFNGKISAFDGFPQEICSSCTRKFTECDNIIRAFLLADAKIKQQYNALQEKSAAQNPLNFHNYVQQPDLQNSSPELSKQMRKSRYTLQGRALRATRRALKSLRLQSNPEDKIETYKSLKLINNVQYGQQADVAVAKATEISDEAPAAFADFEEILSSSAPLPPSRSRPPFTPPTSISSLMKPFRNPESCKKIVESKANILSTVEQLQRYLEARHEKFHTSDTYHLEHIKEVRIAEEEKKKADNLKRFLEGKTPQCKDKENIQEKANVGWEPVKSPANKDSLVKPVRQFVVVRKGALSQASPASLSRSMMLSWSEVSMSKAIKRVREMHSRRNVVQSPSVKAVQQSTSLNVQSTKPLAGGPEAPLPQPGDAAGPSLTTKRTKRPSRGKGEFYVERIISNAELNIDQSTSDDEEHQRSQEVDIQANFEMVHQPKIQAYLSKRVHAYECLRCSLRIQQKEDFIRHIRCHIRLPDSDWRRYRIICKNSYLCEFCDNVSPKVRDHENHMRRTHRASQHICELCGVVFKGYRRLRVHLASHETGIQAVAVAPKKFSCKYCRAVFGSMDELKKHHPEHMAECEVCGKTMTKASMYYHMNHHRSMVKDRSGAPHICPICGKTLANRNSLRLHIACHSALRPFSCHLCPKTFKFKPLLKNHVLSHSRDIKRFFCSICKKGFHSPKLLRLHVKRHNRERKYECPHCPLVFMDSKTLGKHEKNTHRAILQAYPMPFKCDECDRGFLLSSSLLKHKQWHVRGGIRCNQCTVAFDTPASLQEHLVCHSAGQTTVLHLCPICNVSCRSEIALQMHQSFHVDRAEWTCKICQRTFQKRAAYAGHIKVHKRQNTTEHQSNAEPSSAANAVDDTNREESPDRCNNANESATELNNSQSSGEETPERIKNIFDIL